MDKYEFRVKYEQIQKLKEKGEYQVAATIADTMEWKRVKNISELLFISDIYEKAKEYEKSQEILLIAYERSPIGRMILYRLSENAIKRGDFEEAKEYYEDFINISPRDAKRYVLKYKIALGTNQPIEKLIEPLVRLKNVEYSDEWAYELAYLYHRAGMEENCIKECDDVILWFGEGKFVKKAMDLKLKYTSLTNDQQSRYEKTLRDEEERLEEIERVAQQKEELRQQQLKAAQEENISEKNVRDKFNTKSLQTELSKELQQILSANKMTNVTQSLAYIKELVETSQIPNLNIPEGFQALTQEEASKAIEEEDVQVEEEVALAIDFKNLTSQDLIENESESDDSESMVTQQITGQMSIEDVLLEWEKTKQAVEEAKSEEEKKRLEVVKMQAVQQTNELLGKISEIIPEEEPIRIHIEVPKEEPEISFPIKELVVEGGIKEKPKGIGSKLRSLLSLPEEDSLEDLEEETNSKDLKASASENIVENVNENSQEKIEETTPVEEDSDLEKSIDLQELKNITEMDEIEDLDNDGDQEELMEDSKEVMASISESKRIHLEKTFTEEQRLIFTYFTSVRGMEEQILSALEHILNAGLESKTSITGNVIISGGSKMGKTILATNLVKAIQQAKKQNSGKIGRISGDALNKKDIKATLEKMAGGYLIVEQAGGLKEKTIHRLSNELEKNTKNLLLILEDSDKNIENIMEKSREFRSKFTEKIVIPDLNNDELVTFGRAYANELAYDIDEMGILALYNKIGRSRYDEKPVTLEEVKAMIDKAILSAEKKGLKKMADILFSRRYNEEDYVIIREKDFEVE